MNSRFLPALALACLLAMPALAQEAAPDAAQPQPAPAAEAPAPAATAPELDQLSPYITDVQVLGPWADGESNGVWRTVLLQAAGDPDGNRFFVQQVREDEGQLSVLTTTEIVEVSRLNGAIVNYRADEPSEDAPSTLSLFLDIVPLDGEIAETYELFVTPGEPYVFGPASN
ncbi:hypothetical protein NDN16_11425 [Aureimonas altamirensis]|uniref:hypothetical protein n=1 Tax=Aureimonas altamirensis TaxID=370622 RepID=UPI002036C53F|nr:hypothetical protein [Aureimonas altamirensis]MCM2504282.1 hypothetical protein [Aureimonas altamirensis]